MWSVIRMVRVMGHWGGALVVSTSAQTGRLMVTREKVTLTHCRWMGWNGGCSTGKVVMRTREGWTEVMTACSVSATIAHLTITTDHWGGNGRNVLVTTHLTHGRGGGQSILPTGSVRYLLMWTCGKWIHWVLVVMMHHIGSTHAQRVVVMVWGWVHWVRVLIDACRRIRIEHTWCPMMGRMVIRRRSHVDVHIHEVA